MIVVAKERILKVKIGDQEVELDVDHRRPPEASYKDALYWGLLWFDQAGRYFSMPQLAKHQAIHTMDSEYRFNIRTFDIGSMTGQERGEMKKPKRDLTKEEKQEEAAFWQAFDSWVQ